MTARLVLLRGAEAEVVSPDPVYLELAHMGYDVRIANSVQEALTIAQHEPVNAVVIDVTVPEYDGLEMCRSIRKDGDGISIIALNQSDPALYAAALAAGANVVMNQPIEWSQLQQWVSESAVSRPSASETHALFGQTEPDIRGTAALLSHDLRSPICTVISSLEVLVSIHYAGHDPQAQEVQLLRGALDAAYRQLNLVSDLIDLARLEMNDYELRREEADVVQLLHKALESQRRLIEMKELNIELDLPEEPVLASVDTLLIQRVFFTLLDNALKFTTHHNFLQIGIEYVNEAVHIVFTDNGREILPEFEQRILERAPQWDGRQQGTRTSVAMGLPFVHKVALAHGGNFTAQTDPTTKLTVFTLMLPGL